MNPLLLAVVSLRSLGLLFSLQGQAKASESLNLLANGIEAGADVDAHMADVAELLKSGAPNDWEGAHARIKADSDRLQGS